MPGSLFDSYLETVPYSREFMRSWNHPPTLAAKVQHMRAIAQAKVSDDDLWELDPDFVEFGKLQVRHAVTGQLYLVRSSGAVAIEQSMRLFDARRYLVGRPVILVRIPRKSGHH